MRGPVTFATGWVGSHFRTMVAFVLILLVSGCVTTVESPLTEKASESKALATYIQLGLAYIQEGDYAQAKKHLERALEIDPKSAGAHAAMGLILQHQGDLKLAEQEFKSALSYNSGFTRGRTYYAAFLYDQGRLPEAIAQLEAATKDVSFDDRAQVYANLGLIYARQGADDKAMDAYEKSLRLNPGQPGVFLSISELKRKQGNNAEAWQYYNRFLDQVKRGFATQSAGSLSLGAKLAHLNGDRNTEASLLLLLRNQFPQSPEAQNYQSTP